jgi:hypothetical protein
MLKFSIGVFYLSYRRCREPERPLAAVQREYLQLDEQELRPDQRAHLPATTLNGDIYHYDRLNMQTAYHRDIELLGMRFNEADLHRDGYFGGWAK